MSIKTLAKQWLNHFETKTRDNGETFVTMTDDRPQGLYNAVYEAHGGMLPDDYKYQFCEEALQLIAEYGEDASEYVEADIYNADLAHWLASNLTRGEYVDEAVREYGSDARGGIYGLLSLGQYNEKMEVLGVMLNALGGNIEAEAEE